MIQRDSGFFLSFGDRCERKHTIESSFWEEENGRDEMNSKIPIISATFLSCCFQRP